MVFKRLVHEPKQAKCCNHALIPICNTPMVGHQNFILLKKSNPPFGVSIPFFSSRSFQPQSPCSKPSSELERYTSPKFLRCSLVGATGLPRGFDSICFSLSSRYPRTSSIPNSMVEIHPPTNPMTGLGPRLTHRLTGNSTFNLLI
jgi:hypothetical protein